MTNMHFKKEEDANKIDAILSAAQKKFGQYGLAKTTMNDIANELGMGKASLYYYFSCKEALFEAVIQKEQDEFLTYVSKILDSESTAESLFKLFIKRRQVFFEKCINLSQLKYDSLTSTPLACKLIGDFYKKEEEIVQAILKLGIAQNEFKQEMDIKSESELLVLMLQGIRLATIKRKNDTILNKEDHIQLTKNLMRTIEMFSRNMKA